jgi:hypothetical protein
MADPQFWSKSAESFRRLQAPPPQPGDLERDSHYGLGAQWRGEECSEGVDPWYFFGGEAKTEKLFKQLAINAAVRLGHFGGPSAVFLWLDLLRMDDFHFECIEPTGGYIYRVCEASAEYCLELEKYAKAFTNAAAPDLPRPTPPALSQETQRGAFGPINKRIRAIKQAEEADPELRRKGVRIAADYGAMLRRRLGIPVGEADQQENLLRGCRDHALTSLDLAVRKVPLRIPTSEADLEAACDEIRDRIVLQEWDGLLRQYNERSDCTLKFKQFEYALWTERATWIEGEGYTSLQAHGRAALRKRAAELAKATALDSEAGTPPPPTSGGSGPSPGAPSIGDTEVEPPPGGTPKQTQEGNQVKEVTPTLETPDEAEQIRRERHGLVTAFKAEGRKKGIRITDEMIAKAANQGRWNDRTMVTWWKRNDPGSGPVHDRKIRAVLNQDPASIWTPVVKSKLRPK